MKQVSIVILCLLGLSASCAQRPKMSAFTRGSAADAAVDAPLSLELSSLEDDALIYTWGMVAGKPKQAATISLKRLAVWDKANGKLSDEIQGQISHVCSQMALFDADKEARSRLENVSNFYFGWRSHVSFQDKEALAEALEQEGVEGLACVAELKVESGTSTLPYHIVVNPFPASGNLSGADDIETAVSQGLSLIAKDKSGVAFKYKEANALDLSDEFKRSDLALGVKALTADAVSVTAAGPVLSSTCYRDINNAELLVNPKLMIEMNYDVSIEGGHQVIDVASGRGDSQLCKSITPVLADGSVRTGVSCGMSNELLTNGETCNFGVVVENKDDPQNTMRQAIELAEPAFEKLDVSTKPGALKGIGESPDNPLYTGQTKLIGFSPDQTRSVETAFNLWLFVSPSSYNDYFKDHLVQITYQGNVTTNCQQGAGAYVESFNTDRFNWCIGGAMDDNSVTQQTYPEALMYVAITALHETLHTRMHYHDATDPRGAAHAPCDGTSKSAIIAHDMYICKDPICLPFRDRAVQAFRSELDYSLGTDPRVNMGRCAQWKADMGIQ